MLNITVSTQTASQLRQIAGRVPGAINRSVREVVEDVVLPEAVEQTGRIYDVPPGVSSTGRPLWEQTGDLLNSIRTQFTPLQGRVAWQAPYAAPRFALWVTRFPRNPAGGVRRKNDAPADTVAAVLPKIGPEFEVRLEKNLGL